MNQGVRCDLSTGSHVIMLPPLDQLQQHQASLEKKQIQTMFFFYFKVKLKDRRVKMLLVF